MHYFDYAATCPLDEDALEAYVQASKEYFGNTSSLHDEGTKAASLLEHCRGKMAGMLNVDREGVYFTSGGTESNEIALYALLKSRKGSHILTSEGEHSSIRNLFVKLNEEGYEITIVPLNANGEVDLHQLQKEIREETIFVSVQHVNSDIGMIQPIKEISQICSEHGVLFHSDCVQSFGKVEVKEVSAMVDSLSISSHKVYGPKGVGAVYIRPSLTFTPRIPGSTHESGVRAGTVNLPAIAAFTVAAEKMVTGLKDNQGKISLLKKSFLQALEETREHWTLVGDTCHNIVPAAGLCLHHIEGQWAMLEGNRHGYAFSTGSACSLRDQGPPPTLRAMGFSDEEAKAFIRISFSHRQTVEEVQGLALFLNGIMKPVKV